MKKRHRHVYHPGKVRGRGTYQVWSCRCGDTYDQMLLFDLSRFAA